MGAIAVHVSQMEVAVRLRPRKNNVIKKARICILCGPRLFCAMIIVKSMVK